MQRKNIHMVKNWCDGTNDGSLDLEFEKPLFSEQLTLKK
jgi:hypothetical protein